MAEHYLYAAYAGEPIVTTWLYARGYTTDDLEAEMRRLDRAIEGRRVGAPIVDIAWMDREMAEKRRTLERLLTLQQVWRGVEREFTGYEERMRELGYPTVAELEEAIYRLREQVADPSSPAQNPPQEIRVYLHRFCSRCRDVTRHKLIEALAWECERCGKLHKYPAIPLSSSSPEIPIVLKDHTEGNISALAMQVQTEGWIGVRHDYRLRHWTPIVRVGMAPEEPVEYTAHLLSIRHERIDGYEWSVERAKAERTLALLEPLLMADKKEEAKYMLNMTGIRIPDTYIRPIYYTIHEAHRKAVFLYSQYVDFPVKHSLILHIGDPLPKPLKPLFIHPLQYTPDRRPIYWHEGKTLHQNDLYTP